MPLHAGSSLVTPRSDLGLAFEEFDTEANEAGFVGFRIAPVAEVANQFDQFRVLKAAAMLQPRRTERNSDGSYQDATGQYTTDTYRTQDHGLEFHVDFRREAAYRDLIDEEAVGAEIVRYGIMEAHEQRVIDVIKNLSVGDTVAGGSEWDIETADVTTQMNSYIQQFRLQCGVRPNALVVDSQVVDALMENQSVQDKFVGSDRRTARDITLTGLAAALKLDEVIEANSVKNTATAPKAVSFAENWPAEKGLLFRKSTSRNMARRQFMRTIHWGADGSRIGGAFEEYEVPNRRGKMLRARMDVTEKVIYSNCAFVIDNLLS